MGAGSEDSPAGSARAEAAADVPLGALPAAAVRLLASARAAIGSLAALLLAEARITGASVGRVLLACVALVAFTVSLWGCVVVLLGWALATALHSLGVALLTLVVLHLLLLGATALLLRRTLKDASFPHSRSEFGAMRRTLQADLARFRQATGSPEASE